MHSKRYNANSTPNCGKINIDPNEYRITWWLYFCLVKKRTERLLRSPVCGILHTLTLNRAELVVHPTSLATLPLAYRARIEIGHFVRTSHNCACCPGWIIVDIKFGRLPHLSRGALYCGVRRFFFRDDLYIETIKDTISNQYPT